MKQVITESSNKKDVAIRLRKQEQFDKPLRRINVQFQACVLHFPSHVTFPGKPILSTKSQCYEDLVKSYYKAILNDIIDCL